jgi:hypothetical protein
VRIYDLPALLGASHKYVDLLLGNGLAERLVPVLPSMLKIRSAGFAGCCDSLASLSLAGQLGRIEAVAATGAGHVEQSSNPRGSSSVR